VKSERKISDELLTRYLLREVSEQEEQDVERWINADASNKDEFDNFRLIWEQSAKLAPVSTINVDDAWARFQQRTKAQPTGRQIPLPLRNMWKRAAAILLLLAGGALATWYNAGSLSNYFAAGKKPVAPAKTAQAAVATDKTVPVMPPAPVVSPVAEPKKADIAVADAIERKHKAPRHNPKSVKSYYTQGVVTKTKTNEYICNGTPYPFEICIVQTVKCKNTKASEISTCSTLQPDQSGKLGYKPLEKRARHCKTTIDEIRITKMSTGETIVLNDHSTPSTAQNFFAHLTGRKKGDVMAGMFQSDDDCGLTYDSNGQLKLQ